MNSPNFHNNACITTSKRRDINGLSTLSGERACALFDLSWKEWVLFWVILLAVALPRFLSLDHFVTADEPLWLERSANFYCALSRGSFADTFQREHPGVVTMWSGTLGFLWKAPEYREACPISMGREGHEVVFRERNFDPITLLAGGRTFVVLGITLALGLAFLYAHRLWGSLPAWLGFWLLALDPFYLAHSRLLHLDGLLSTFILLSLLAFLSYLRWHQRRDLVVSGLVAGLSWLTKSPGFFLAPFMGLLSLMAWLGPALPGHLWGTLHPEGRKPQLRFKEAMRFVGPLLVWGLLGALVFVALWPAMWVAPVGTLSRVFDIASEYAAEGHGNALFFNGELIPDGRLGIQFYYFYPSTYLWRATPITLLGLMLLMGSLIMYRGFLQEDPSRKTILALGLFVLLFMFFMSLGTKKFDRYLLPIYPVLDLLAGIGWAKGLDKLRHALTGKLRCVPARIMAGLVLGIVLVGQVLPVYKTFPYYFSYYNPLLGGSRRAPKVMQIGWGEGLDQAARYLNEKPDAEQLTVFSWYETGCFSYLFDGISQQIPTQYVWDPAKVESFFAADYVVVYIHQWQRKMAELLLDYLALQTPEHTIWLDGLEYARIYKLSSNHDFYVDPTYQSVDLRFGDAIWLEGQSIPRRQFVPGETLSISLSWRAESPPTERLKVFVHLLDASGGLVAQGDAEPMRGFSPTDRWETGEQIADRQGVSLPDGLPPGHYTLSMGLYRPDGQRLPIFQDGELLGDALSLGEITILSQD